MDLTVVMTREIAGDVVGDEERTELRDKLRSGSMSTHRPGSVNINEHDRR